jgi:AraC family transcriptional regulator of adaptative response/methylated-DNA-[protein]-cysteine methyltransferase
MDTAARHAHTDHASIEHDPLERARVLLDAGEPTLAELAAAVGLSASHLQRRFRARFGLSPAEYLAQRRLGALKSGLKAGRDVSAALYDAGYGSPSRVYETGAAKLGMTPARYRAGGDGEDIRWSSVDTALGPALVAATARGICMVELGADADALERRLRAEFPRARLQQVDAGRDDFLAPRVRAVADALAGKRAQVPVDLIGTAFQKRVWDALMKIPSGETRSCAEGRARGRQRLRAQPGRDRGALSSGDPRRRLARRLSLGARSQAPFAGTRTRGLRRVTRTTAARETVVRGTAVRGTMVFHQVPQSSRFPRDMRA